MSLRQRAKQAAPAVTGYIGGRAGAAASSAAQRAQQETFKPVRSAWDDAWAVAGYSLLLVLLYWLVNERAARVGRLWELGGNAAQAWMSPTADPLAHLERALGHNIAAGGAATAPSSPGEPSAAGGGGGPQAPPPGIAGRNIPAPGISQTEAERLGITPRRRHPHHTRRRRHARSLSTLHNQPRIT